jgi:O-methyltransferase domain
MRFQNSHFGSIRAGHPYPALTSGGNFGALIRCKDSKPATHQENRPLETIMIVDNDTHGTMLNKIFHARIFAQILKCVAEFSLADHLSVAPQRPENVAAAAGLDTRATGRLLRYCSAVGLTVADEDGSYRATPLLATLKSDDPLSLRAFALAQHGPGQWAVLGKLDDAFRTGLPQAEAALGCSLYEYYSRAEHADEANAYRRGLAGLNTAIEKDFANLVDTRMIRSALDVGGSVGSMVLALMQANPDLQGAVLDLPAVAEAASAEARSRGLADRFEFIAGDFFEHVPASDLYVLKHVLGNWPDNTCLKLLRNCRASARSESRLLIVDNVINDAEPSQLSLDIDIITLVAVGGELRGLHDYQRLLEAAGFEFRKLHSLSKHVSMIEAVCP